MGDVRRYWPLIVAAMLAAAMIAAAWPGIAMFDTVTQFGEVLSGSYDDWHPPAMARLWSVLHGAFGGGAGPMLALQAVLYWLGLGLVASALARTGNVRGAVAMLLCGILPVFAV